MEALEKIVRLLDDDNPRKRIAAAIVLGELGTKDHTVIVKLMTMAADPLDAYAEAAIEALGKLQSLKALPVLLDGLARTKDVHARAREAIAALGEAALPEVKARLEDATPEVRAALSELLPAVGGRASFEMTLKGLLGQAWEAINRVALSVRQEAKSMTSADKRVMRTQVEKFLAVKRNQEDENAVRGALKILGFLELEDSQPFLLAYLSEKQPSAVRVEAAMAMRFACANGPTKKSLQRLMVLLTDMDPLVASASRDSLTVLNIGADFADELAELCTNPDMQVALWAIHHLGRLAQSEKGAAAKLAAHTLVPVARSAARARAEAASKVLAALPGGEAWLVEALCDAEDEVGAQVLADILAPLATKLAAKLVKALLAAGQKNLSKSLAVAKKQLEPVRAADPEAWADTLRAAFKALQKKDPARADAIADMVGRSKVATAADRFSMAVQQLGHHAHDFHPRARSRDPALIELERLHAERFGIATAVLKDKKLSDDARYYVGVHFAEKPQFESKNVGAEVLEALAKKGRGKIAKAAKNQIKMLQL